jgi:hypothetical protein
MYSTGREHQGRTINLIKTLVKTNLLLIICPSLEDSVVYLYKIDQAQRHHYWMFDVERSMFDV